MERVRFCCFGETLAGFATALVKDRSSKPLPELAHGIDVGLTGQWAPEVATGVGTARINVTSPAKGDELLKSRRRRNPEPRMLGNSVDLAHVVQSVVPEDLRRGGEKLHERHGCVNFPGMFHAPTVARGTDKVLR